MLLQRAAIGAKKLLVDDKRVACVNEMSPGYCIQSIDADDADDVILK